MKINQLGTLVIVGVALSVTAACGGSPIKPTAIGPSFGDGAAAASVTVSTLRLAGSTEQLCTSQPSSDQSGDQSDTQNVEAPAMTCDSPVDTGSSAETDSSADTEPQSEVVVNEETPTDAARFFR